MISRNLPLLLLALIFIGFSSVLFVRAPERILPPPQEESAVLKEAKHFTGRVVMPSLDDLYVLDNSAGRDLVLFESFLQGRTAGLHWVADQHFRNEKAGTKHRKDAQVHDIYMGLKLTVDSLGFMEPEILFCNTADQDFKKLVLDHVKAYWRYPRGASGKFEVWMPIVWLADWK